MRHDAVGHLFPLELANTFRNILRRRNSDSNTEDAYIRWIQRFIRFHGGRHPDEMGRAEITAFIRHLPNNTPMAQKNRKQALQAILILYRLVLNRPVSGHPAKTADNSSRLPTMLTSDDAEAVLSHLHGTFWIMASLMFGTGLRMEEVVRLRIGDIDFVQGRLTVRSVDGKPKRSVLLPVITIDRLKAHLGIVHQRYKRESKNGGAQGATARERAYIFPEVTCLQNPASGGLRRSHINTDRLRHEIESAMKRSGIKPSSDNTGTPRGLAVYRFEDNPP